MSERRFRYRNPGLFGRFEPSPGNTSESIGRFRSVERAKGFHGQLPRCLAVLEEQEHHSNAMENSTP